MQRIILFLLFLMNSTYLNASVCTISTKSELISQWKLEVVSISDRLSKEKIKCKLQKDVLEDFTPDKKLIFRLAQKSPEKISLYNVERYFSKRKLDRLIERGKDFIRKWSEDLHEAELKYGVSKYVITAIIVEKLQYRISNNNNHAITNILTQIYWHYSKYIETNKSYYLTKASTHINQFVALVKIINELNLPSTELRSASDGAMGIPYFLPTKYLDYSVDGNNDGIRDIWNSMPDVIASVANFLNKHGWIKDQIWGFEVDIENKHCIKEGKHKKNNDETLQYSTLFWINNYNVEILQNTHIKQQITHEVSYLLQPIGNYGPKYLVHHNFYVIKNYLMSDRYGVLIGLVSDSIKASKPLPIDSWNDLPNIVISKTKILELQLKLIGNSYDVGGADGIIGNKTRRSIGKWQLRYNQDNPKDKQDITCYPNDKLLRSLNVAE